MLTIACSLCFDFMVTSLAVAEDQVRSVTNLAEMDLEQLVNVQVASVYGASKYEQKVTRAPSSVSIVTADEIKKFGHRTLADVLRSVRGLYVSDDRNYSYLGVRGFLRPGDYNTRVLILVDGHRMNDNVYDSAYVGREGVVDVDLIERVEVIRGPSSSVYGSSAFFGVINVVTKKGGQIGGAEVSAEAGSFDTYKGRFSFGEKFQNDVEWLFSGSYYLSEGQERLYYPEFDQRISADPRAVNNGIARRRDGEEVVNLFTSLGYRELTLSGFFTYRHKDVPTASYGTLFNDGAEETTDYRGYVDLKYDHDFNEELHLQGRLFYDNYTYYGAYPYNYAAPGDPVDRVLFRDGTVGEWVGTEWQLTGRLWDRHTLVVGGEYRENLRQYQFSYDDVEPRFYYLDDDQTSRIVGLYAQGEVALLTNLVLNAGVRYDHYFESFGGTLNPRLGLIYNPWKGSAFKALYGEAFRAPNMYERFYNSEQGTLPELQPETIQTTELVYEQYFARDYRLSVSGYYYTVEDLISQTTTPADDLVFENVAQAEARGVELELEGKYDSGLMARVSYALQRTEDDSGRELTSSPRHLAKFNLSVPLYRDKVFAGLELQYRGTVRTLAGRRADDYVTANLTLFSRELARGLEVSASVYNLFDANYGYPGAEDHLQDVLRHDGRSFRLKLTYRF
jgi:iron complex outermembrane receptor protein